jgi:DNA-binding winged helix-turn-helix (wHTH) protein
MKIYKYNWKNNEKRKTLYNRNCTILKFGKKNSILIEFLDNNQREIVSRNSVKLIKESNNLF